VELLPSPNLYATATRPHSHTLCIYIRIYTQFSRFELNDRRRRTYIIMFKIIYRCVYAEILVHCFSYFLVLVKRLFRLCDFNLLRGNSLKKNNFETNFYYFSIKCVNADWEQSTFVEPCYLNCVFYMIVFT
jgi:hypothetical protein